MSTSDHELYHILSSSFEGMDDPIVRYLEAVMHENSVSSNTEVYFNFFKSLYNSFLI